MAERDLVGLYQGVGYAGQGLRPTAVRLQIFADGSFSGHLPTFDGFSKHNGEWHLADFDTSKGCRNVNFSVGAHYSWTYCFFIGRDKVTGIDCYSGLHGREICLMRRHVENNAPIIFDLPPLPNEIGS